MPRGRKKKPWWEEPPPPRKPLKDEMEAEVKAVIAELLEDWEALKAYHAGADTAPLSHRLPSDRRGKRAALGTHKALAGYVWREGEAANLNTNSEFREGGAH
jgi:hypothetical protein